MNHIIEIKGDDVINFSMFKIREKIENGEPNEEYPLPIKWNIMTNVYSFNLKCTDEQLIYIRLRYAQLQI